MPADDEAQLVANADAMAVIMLDAASSGSITSNPAEQEQQQQNDLNVSISSSNAMQPPLALESTSRLFILEPAVFLLFLAKYLSESVFQNLILYQSCIVHFNYTQQKCAPFLGVIKDPNDFEPLETEVQHYATNIVMTRSLLESVMPALVSLFIGPWSDKFGRRPILLSAFTGYMLGYIILTILGALATPLHFSPWLFLLSSVPYTLSGGSCALITGIYCYIADVASQKAKALRMVLNEAALSAGMVLGNISSGYIYDNTNVYTVFGISMLLAIVAWLYVMLFVKESLNDEQMRPGSKLREFFRFDLVKDLISTCIERRPNFDRAIIWLTMIALVIGVFTVDGESNFTYMFVREKFFWTLKDYTQFSAARIVVQIVGSIFCMSLLKKTFQLSLVSLSMIAFGSCVLEAITRATAVYSWEMYVGLSLGSLRGIMGPISRAILSSIAPPSDIGKIFALTTSMQQLTPLLSSPTYKFIYSSTLGTYPGFFNFFSAALYLTSYCCIAIVYGIQKSLSYSAYQSIGS